MSDLLLPSGRYNDQSSKKRVGRQVQDNTGLMQDLQLVSQPPEHGAKGEADSQCQQDTRPIVLWHAPVGCHVLGKDGPELCHDGFGILGVKFELLATLYWGTVVCQQVGIVPEAYRSSVKASVGYFCRSRLSQQVALAYVEQCILNKISEVVGAVVQTF